MNSSSDQTLLLVQFVRTFDLPPDKLFAAWTEPDIIQQWWRASDEYEAIDADLEKSKGGSFRFVMHNKSKNSKHVAFGTIREFDPPTRMSMSWNWKDEMEGDQSLLSLQFTDLKNGKTELTLRHENFPTTQFRNDHEKGWMGCLRALSDEIELKNIR